MHFYGGTGCILHHGSFTLAEFGSETDADSMKFYYQWVLFNVNTSIQAICLRQCEYTIKIKVLQSQTRTVSVNKLITYVRLHDVCTCIPYVRRAKV